MDKETKRKVKNLVLTLREKFEDDIAVVLGRYGIFADRKGERADRLTYLSKDEKRLKDRIEKIIQKEMGSGITQGEATKAYIRDTSFTHINRLIGLCCMEARGLIDETIKTRDVYSGRSLRHRNFLHAHPEYASDPEDGLVPCLKEVCAEITDEIKILFDPDSEISLVWPRYHTLKDAIALINQLDESVWTADDMLGWVYQYFNSKEKDRIFEEVNKRKKKIAGADIIPATQLYTEKYMVRFLVENSLGALWQEMYPESKLHESWEYFVPDPNETTRNPKPVKDITFLDPACGSGHFLLVAFDLFYQMYVAESIVPKEEIPHYILTYNLHGIDIDRRAIQLSALNLYLKAKQYQPDFSMKTRNTAMNLVVADAVMMDNNKLNEFLAEVGGDKRLEELVKTIWTGMQNVRELGSLLKVEEQIDALMEQELSANDKPLMIAEVVDSTRRNWEKRKAQLMQGFRNYYEKASQVFDVNRQLFANEAIKGVQLLDLLERRYDVVATNPPYMSNRNMGTRLKRDVSRLYPKTSSDLYAAFIGRCLQLTQRNGYTSMITQQSFMFITTYEALREIILTSCHIRTMAHLGPHAFEDIGGEKVNTTMFTFAKQQGDAKIATFLRLVDKENKADTLKGLDIQEYQTLQRNLKVIDGWPMVYWINRNIRNTLASNYRFGDIFTIANGMRIGNNDLFLRYFWEIPEEEFLVGDKWKPYNKGGSSSKFFELPLYTVRWDTQALDFYEQNHSHRRKELYFRECITYTLVSSKGFSCRWLPKGYVFDAAGPSLFCEDNRFLNMGLAILNTKLAGYLLNILNPTINFPPADVARLPFQQPKSATQRRLGELVSSCVDAQKALLRSILTQQNFQSTALDWAKSQQPNAHTLTALFRVYLDHKETELVKLHTYEGLIDREIFDLYEIDGEDLKQILDEQGTPAGWYPLVETFDLIPDDLLPEAKTALENHERKAFSGDELNELTLRLQELYEEKGKSIEEIAIALEIHPASVVALRQELDLVNPAELKDEVENFLTHRILESLKADSYGIIPLDEISVGPTPTHPYPSKGGDSQEGNMLTRLRSALEETFGADDAFAIEDEMRDILGKPLEKWLETDFFKKHISQYKKRPIVWHVQSPDKNFACYVYYHKLDNDTLPKVRSNYLWRALDVVKQQLSASEEQLLLFEQVPRSGIPPRGTGDKSTREQHQAIEKIEKVVSDLQELDARLESIISAGYHPDIDDGVKVNITPLQEAGVLAVKQVV
jgi:hypothetical protein